MISLLFFVVVLTFFTAVELHARRVMTRHDTTSTHLSRQVCTNKSVEVRNFLAEIIRDVVVAQTGPPSRRQVCGEVTDLL